MSLAIYIHLPWCVARCPYCDFNAHQKGQKTNFSGYVDAVLQDLAVTSEMQAAWPIVTSIYFGGGTPSLFAPNQVGQIIDGVAKHFQLAANIEVSMECNPGAREHGDLSDYRAVGINRLSIGVQSLQAHHLQRLGRVHNVNAAKQAVKQALGAGFNSINVDLMYGLPGQSQVEAMADLDAVLAMGVPHISWYQLTLEPNTVFAKYPPAGMPQQDLIVDIEVQGRARLLEAGFQRYEISAYSQLGHHCRHNLHVWRFGDYLGIGAGAHGKISQPQNHILRTVKLRQPESYMANPFKTNSQLVTNTHEVVFQYMLNRLRLFEPVRAQDFEQETGLAWESVVKILQQAIVEPSFFSLTREQFLLTPKGYEFLDDVVSYFMPQDATDH